MFRTSEVRVQRRATEERKRACGRYLGFAIKAPAIKKALPPLRSPISHSGWRNIRLASKSCAGFLQTMTGRNCILATPPKVDFLGKDGCGFDGLQTRQSWPYGNAELLSRRRRPRPIYLEVMYWDFCTLASRRGFHVEGANLGLSL